MDPHPSSNSQSEAGWVDLRPRAVKLINNVSAANIDDTAQRFIDLGFPWADSCSAVPLAELIVSASASHGFYAESYSQLITVLCSRWDDLPSARQEPGTTGSMQIAQFSSTVRGSLFEKIRLILADMAENDQDPTKERKRRDKLVNSCKFAASLFRLSVFSVKDLHRFLQCLGVLNTLSLETCEVASEVEAPNCTPEQQVMPRVTMLSGAYPSTQPRSGETMSDLRDRLACELNFTSERLVLLAGQSEVPPDETLDGLKGIVQVLVRQVVIKEEYRVEAACALLSTAMPDLLSSESGKMLLSQVFALWDQMRQDLPKRAQFMIMDVKSATAGQCSVP